MGLHQRHHVGRALHGEEAREAMDMHRRDSHGSDIVIHVPLDVQVQDDVATAVSVVYVTLAQTFNGPASLSTLSGTPSAAAAATPTTPSAQTEAATTTPTQAAAPSSTTIAAPSSSSNSISPEESSYLSVKSAAQAVSTSSSSFTGLDTATSPLLFTSSVAIATATNLGPHAALTSSSATASPFSSSSGSSAAATAAVTVQQSTSSGGLSGPAKAGLAIAIVVGLVMAAGLIFFCWRRKKNTGHEELLDEKHASFADASARSYEARHAQNAQAAQGSSPMTEKVSPSVRAARTTSTAPRLSLRPGSSFLPILGGAAQPQNQNGSAWERRPGNTKQNPYADNAALLEKQPRPVSPASNPFEESQNAAAPNKHSPQSSLEVSRPTTSQSSKAGPAAAAAAAGAAGVAGAVNGAPAPRGPNNVHRVQLDFKPSMDDELELRSGQLVRMLHEYDDGWALCIRMDRSQQGVAPRTCLSKLPVKPRPQGPPGSSRPGTAHSMDSRPSMQSQRSVSPPQVSRDPTPELGNPDASNRKPVPGQAM